MNMYKNPLEMTVEEWELLQNLSREEHKALYDSMTRDQWNKHAFGNNQRIVNETMEDWGCTELEAWAVMEFDGESLEDTQLKIAQVITYNRMIETLPIENARFLREEFYKGKPEADDKEFIQSEARDMAEEIAWDSVYTDEIVDDYEEMTEAEKEAVVYGT